MWSWTSSELKTKDLRTNWSYTSLTIWIKPISLAAIAMLSRWGTETTTISKAETCFRIQPMTEPLLTPTTQTQEAWPTPIIWVECSTSRATLAKHCSTNHSILATIMFLISGRVLLKGHRTMERVALQAVSRTNLSKQTWPPMQSLSSTRLKTLRYLEHLIWE